MCRKTEPIITVNTVFAGTQTDSQAYIDLITQKQLLDNTQLYLDKPQEVLYDENTSKMQNTQHTGG